MKKDVTKKRCLSDNERYADLINGVVFKGKQKVHAEDLLEMDTQTGLWSNLGIHGKRQHRQKYRDLIRKVAMGINFAVIGIENQEEVHYLMPLRSVAYDVAEYGRADFIRVLRWYCFLEKHGMEAKIYMEYWNLRIFWRK